MTARAHALTREFRVHSRSDGLRSALFGPALLAMAARGRGRHGPPFGRGGMPFDAFFFGGPRGFPRGRRARRGAVRAALLLLLAEEPRNGYQIMQEIENRSGGVWQPSPGSVYPALAQLEDEGLVRMEERDGRRTFVLTEAGHSYVAERRGDLIPPWEEMSGSVDADVAGLIVEMRQVGMAAAQIAHVGNEHQVREARKVLGNARRALYGLLAEDEVVGGEGEEDA
jgi:DNA-binding PadR family transcriptional regulator